MWWVRGECCGPFSVIRTIKFIIEKVNIPKTQINRQIDKDAAVHLAVCSFCACIRRARRARTAKTMGGF